jgi:hypothetical protein
MAIAAECHYVRMLQQQKLVSNEPLLAFGNQLSLQFERLAVIDAPEFPQLATTH